MDTIWIVPIEPIDSRYTKQWYENIPYLISVKERKLGSNLNVITIDGDNVPENTTAGAFLNFGATNYYKATQAAKISKMFMDGVVRAGDVFLVTDAWNFVITPIRYMSDLLNIPVEIHGIWHAGAYDPSDILGVKMGKEWSANVERSWFYAADFNYFATEFHRNMFLTNLGIPEEYHHKAILAGQPYDYLPELLEKYQDVEKTNSVLWPHRYNYDKQPEIAEDLANHLDVHITQKQRLSKPDFYKLVGSCKVVFSCSLHENLGTSIIESVLAGAVPVVPDRCCYGDIYLPEFRYPAEWTENYQSYLKNKQQLIDFINEKITNYHSYKDLLEQQRNIIKNKYISSDLMINQILRKK